MALEMDRRARYSTRNRYGRGSLGQASSLLQRDRLARGRRSQDSRHRRNVAFAFQATDSKFFWRLSFAHSSRKDEPGTPTELDRSLIQSPSYTPSLLLRCDRSTAKPAPEHNERNKRLHPSR